jgi:hypothetical protein
MLYMLLLRGKNNKTEGNKDDSSTDKKTVGNAFQDQTKYRAYCLLYDF